MYQTFHYKPNTPLSTTGILPFQNRASYSSKKTKQYDAEAMRYLSYALYPLVIGYSIYALFYKTHKSWYSWVLSSLVGAVYMFGFILMCPQVREEWFNVLLHRMFCSTEWVDVTLRSARRGGESGPQVPSGEGRTTWRTRTWEALHSLGVA